MSPPSPFEAFLVASGIARAGEPAEWRPLTGGVSSEVWCAQLPDRSVVVKQALAQLKVSAHWQVPRERNAYEWAWIVEMRSHLPDAIPEPLAHDKSRGLFAMEFLPPDKYENWKDALLDGRVDVHAAGEVGRRLVALHAGTADRPDLLRAFDTTELFNALRLEPYLFATAEVHRDVASILRQIAVVTASQRRCLVHGDVSPKNILLGPKGPVFLDAECAWYGDPAFDIAFCLNHLLLKALYRSDVAHDLFASFSACASSYFDGVSWEPPAQLEARAAKLLPGLMLARVDGKSPLEYLTRDEHKDVVRQVARNLLKESVVQISNIAEIWERSVGECRTLLS